MTRVYNIDIYNKIDALIIKKMKSLNITGASVSIIDGPEIIYSKGFGFADKENSLKKQ